MRYIDLVIQPKVSVIIPAFNAEFCIAAAIRSVLEQRFNLEIEIIVVDDGSSDGTAKVVSELSSEHHQIRLYKNIRSKGPSGARNTGLIHSTGEYVAFLDADDLWLNNHLIEGIHFLESNLNVDVVLYNFEIREFQTQKLISDWFSEKNSATLKQRSHRQWILFY